MSTSSSKQRQLNADVLVECNVRLSYEAAHDGHVELCAYSSVAFRPP